ncbi:MAG: NfeD family protein [Verrucomicrobiaceae bacterium]
MMAFFLGLAGFLQAEGTDQRVLGKSVEESYEGKVVVIEVGEDDLVNGQSFKFWERALDRVEEEGAKAVVFKLDTPGGLAFATHDLMSKIANLKVPTISYIDPEAMSAGAMIAVSTDRIYMAPGALVGSAAVVSSVGEIDKTMRAKLESFFDAHVRWIVKEKGHRHEVIKAMMVLSDETETIGGVEVKAGQLLALNSSEAVKMLDDGPLFAVAEVKTLEEVLEREGLAEAEVVTATPTGFEKFAWWVASVSGVLILIGLAGGYFEVKTPGFGIGGIVSIVAFTLFFFGNYLAGNMAGYELVALFVLGLILIAVEIFVLPGFGIPGILGLVLVLSSLAFSMVDGVAWNQQQFEAPTASGILDLLDSPAQHLAFGIFGSLAIMWATMRFLPEVPFLKKMMLPATLSAGTGITEEEASGPRIGMTGVATTDLHPSGKAEIDGVVLDVVVESGFIGKGEAVRIVKEDGMGVVVKSA